jgi:hypothetical protein
MKFMCPQKRFTSLLFPIALIALLFSANLQAQSKKSTSSKKAVSKKSAVQAKDVRKDKKATSRKDTKKEQLAKKKGKTDPRKDKAVAKSKEKLSPRELRRQRELDAREARDNKKNSKKKNTAEARRIEAERRREAEARRQAALAEQRRREQAAREARERRLAFERGLRTTTIENIAKDDPAGEDLNVRHAAVNALGGHAGTVVVMEAKTGKILTIVNQDWAIRDSFKPCSTIKLVTGVGGLNENIIDSEGHITNSSTRMPLDYALAKSNNGYFQRVGVNMGSNKMVQYARALGLGEKTGINAEGETPGKVPFNNNNARIYSHGDDFEVTPPPARRVGLVSFQWRQEGRPADRSPACRTHGVHSDDPANGQSAAAKSRRRAPGNDGCRRVRYCPSRSRCVDGCRRQDRLVHRKRIVGRTVRIGRSGRGSEILGGRHYARPERAWQIRSRLSPARFTRRSAVRSNGTVIFYMPVILR